MCQRARAPLGFFLPDGFFLRKFNGTALAMGSAILIPF
jgi:hypothetical protein